MQNSAPTDDGMEIDSTSTSPQIPTVPPDSCHNDTSTESIHTPSGGPHAQDPSTYLPPTALRYPTSSDLRVYPDVVPNLVLPQVVQNHTYLSTNAPFNPYDIPNAERAQSSQADPIWVCCNCQLRHEPGGATAATNPYYITGPGLSQAIPYLKTPDGTPLCYGCQHENRGCCLSVWTPVISAETVGSRDKNDKIMRKTIYKTRGLPDWEGTWRADKEELKAPNDTCVLPPSSLWTLLSYLHDFSVFLFWERGKFDSGRKWFEDMADGMEQVHTVR